jgi:hypothetical protein
LPAFAILQSFVAPAGGDYYKILVNDKVMIDQSVSAKEKTSLLTLPNPGETDKLVVHYSHCGKIGQDRSVFVKDSKGKLLKQWKFADSKEPGVQVKLKEMANAVGGNSTVTLHYSSKELPGGKQLASISIATAKTARL